MSRTLHTPPRTAEERAERIAATRRRDFSIRRTGTRSAVIAAALAEYWGEL